MSADDARLVAEMLAEKEAAKSKADKKKASRRLDNFHQRHLEHTMRLTQQLEKMTGQESRLTILGHLQRGGTPSAADRCWPRGWAPVAPSCSAGTCTA